MEEPCSSSWRVRKASGRCCVQLMVGLSPAWLLCSPWGEHSEFFPAAAAGLGFFFFLLFWHNHCRKGVTCALVTSRKMKECAFALSHQALVIGRRPGDSRPPNRSGSGARTQNLPLHRQTGECCCFCWASHLSRASSPAPPGPPALSQAFPGEHSTRKDAELPGVPGLRAEPRGSAVSSASAPAAH